MEKPKCFTTIRIPFYCSNLHSGSNESWSLKTKFLIGHLSPKLSNHLGINAIYQDPRQNFSLIISHNSILRPLINTHYTLTSANARFHDCFAKHLSKAWFHLDHYRQSKPFLQLHTIHITKKCAGIHLDHIILYLSPKATISNISAQLPARFLGNQLQSSLLKPSRIKDHLIIFQPKVKPKCEPNLEDMLRVCVTHYD